MLRDLTFICAYYINAGMLREQQRIWRNYPEALKRRFHVVVCDDCSPQDPALPHVEPTGIASFQLYRTAVDIRWNWLFCRNLGVSKAPTRWLLLTDIDHVLPAGTLDLLLGMELEERIVYRFPRIDAPLGTPYKPHPNSWLLTREMFEEIGGYDERFSGYYGSDGEFRDRVRNTASEIRFLTAPLVRYPREVIADASTTTYKRKERGIDDIGFARIRRERDREPGWRPQRLLQDYRHEVTL